MLNKFYECINGFINKSLNFRTNKSFPPPTRGYSCDALESNRIVFFNNGMIRPCCQLQKPFYFNPEHQCIEPMLGEAFSLELPHFSFEFYQNLKMRSLQQFSIGNFHNCSGCNNLKQYQKFNDNEKIKCLDFAFYSTCNLRCIYCPLNTWYNHPINDFYDNVVRCIDTLIADKKIDPMANITFSGGEPTLLPGLNDLCQKFRGYSDKITYTFLTNGVIFSEVICELIKEGSPVILLISIDSGTRAGFYRIKGRDHFYDVVSNIKKYKQIGTTEKFRIILKFIIIEENIDQIPPFIDLCKKLDIHDIFYDIDFNTEKNPTIIEGIHNFCSIAETNNIQVNKLGVGL
jgi:pyruvate-formate lyase-activating enzyme